uniref:radical SAM family heme chaperone HemW n=1 Tax=Acetatifactor sp. TaxID=1872090 RepID=UPI004055D67D
MESKKIELYFHIPFCIRKCLYCDFLSAPADASVQDAYMEALLRETRERAKEYCEYTVDTVFIGGGTPTVVDAKWIMHLMKTVYENYKVAENAEISMEVNPGTVDVKKLRCYYESGINRLSIGLQSADNVELQRLGRIHTWENFNETYELAREVGFENINVDVMSALPGQTLESYSRTLAQILSLQPVPEHISAYSLMVEEGTPFHKMYESGSLELPDEDCERLMYEETERILQQYGFSRYEISNYAREGYACRHNCGYWKRIDYVGFGIGAASLVRNVRFQNENSLESYLENPLGCRSDIQTLAVEEQMEEFCFLGLRMVEGISESVFFENFGKPINEVYQDVITKNIADGLLRQEEGRIFLTERGLDVSNYVMAQFLQD